MRNSRSWTNLPAFNRPLCNFDRMAAFFAGCNSQGINIRGRGIPLIETC